MPDQQRAASSRTEPAPPDGSEPTSAAAADAASEDFPDISDLGYEEARDELISIVGRLEGGQIGLEDSMRLWHRGEALAAHCRRWLDGAEATLAATDVPERPDHSDPASARVSPDGSSTDG